MKNPANHYGLSGRELDALQLVAYGVTDNKRIARELGLSLRTVRRYFSSIYRKLDIPGGSCASRIEAVTIAARERLIDFPDVGIENERDMLKNPYNYPIFFNALDGRQQITIEIYRENGRLLAGVYDGRNRENHDIDSLTQFGLSGHMVNSLREGDVVKGYKMPESE